MTLEEIAAEEAKKAEDAKKELQNEIDSFDGAPPTKPASEEPEVKPEVKPKVTPKAEPGPGEPVKPKAEDAAVVQVQIKTEMQQLQTELRNSKGMAHEEREKRKKAGERIDSLEKQIKDLQTTSHPWDEGEEGKPKKIAPEDEELIRAALPELDRVTALIPEFEQVIKDGRATRAARSEENAIKKYGESLYKEVSKIFEAELAGDDAVMADFMTSTDPADFVVRKVIERDPLKFINKAAPVGASAEAIEKARKEGIEEGKKTIIEDLKKKGNLPASLSSVGGTLSAAPQGDSLRKELDSF